MGAGFLCAMTGTDVPVAENQAAYIAGWLRHIREWRLLTDRRSHLRLCRACSRQVV